MTDHGIDVRGWLADRGAVICYATGVSHLDGDLLQCEELQPSRRLSLVRDPGNEHRQPWKSIQQLPRWARVDSS